MPWEFTCLDWIQTHMRTSFGDSFFPIVTTLGDLGFIWILAGGALLFFGKQRRNGIMVLVGLAIGAIICNVALKNIVARSRPCWINSDITLLISMPSDYSFPSGHTLASVIGAILLTYADHRFALFAIPLAILISFSRLYLYVHFPTDVLFSVFLGVIVSTFTIWLFKKFR